MYKYGWTGSAPATGSYSAVAGLRFCLGFSTWALDRFGNGCQGSNSKTPALIATGSAKFGGSIALSMKDALPNAPVFMVVGLQSHANPIDMTPMGAPGCFIYETIDMLLPVVANSAGSYSIKFNVPKKAPITCPTTYIQMFPKDARANAMGLSSSNYVRIVLGN